MCLHAAIADVATFPGSIPASIKCQHPYVMTRLNLRAADEAVLRKSILKS
jgi:hypothetical protein